MNVFEDPVFQLIIHMLNAKTYKTKSEKKLYIIVLGVFYSACNT